MTVGLLIICTGVIGNLLLLASVYYAKRTGRHGFVSDPKWFIETIFFINVAVVDLLYCLFVLVNAAYGIYVQNHQEYYEKNPSASHGICKFIVLSRHNLSIIDGWSTAVIIFNAAFPKIRYFNRLGIVMAKYAIKKYDRNENIYYSNIFPGVKIFQFFCWKYPPSYDKLIYICYYISHV